MLAEVCLYAVSGVGLQNLSPVITERWVISSSAELHTAHNALRTCDVIKMTEHTYFSQFDVTYDQVWWPILGICALCLTHSKYTHSSEHRHTVNTHPEQWAAIYAVASGEQLAVRCLAQGHLVVESWYWRSRKCCTFTPPTYNSCQPTL